MSRKNLPALIVKQWLSDWNSVAFDDNSFRRKPRPEFLIFSLDAKEVRRLSGIQRRTATGPRASDLGIQRAHERNRSQEIAEYIRHGFPWSGISKTKRASGRYNDLMRPGWLPTAIVANILTRADTRHGIHVHDDDHISVDYHPNGTAVLSLPDSRVPNWSLAGRLAPLEIIDGQHRLWAFDEHSDDLTDYQLPVVAYHGLDRSWQAYLFYTINIKPKRINPSLAFDLYPLLRTEDWLERFDDTIYRTSRAQELTEALWSHRASPWYQRIDMLGGYGRKMVTQNSWVRSLQATIVKSWEGPGVRIGGLFGAPVGHNRLVLSWSRAQQAAFLIYAWIQMADTLASNQFPWTIPIRQDTLLDTEDLAFSGSASMLNSDMGVRGFLHILNDMCFVEADTLQLHRWTTHSDSATAAIEVSEALESLKSEAVASFVRELSACLASYDWRSSKATGLSEEERQAKARFRGGTGYRELRIDLLRHLASSDGVLVKPATTTIERLGYDVRP